MRQCTICRHLGKSSVDEHRLEIDYIYDFSGKPVRIYLCPKHSQELFKEGQKRFLIAYRKILEGLIDSDEVKFLRLLEETILKHIDEIY